MKRTFRFFFAATLVVALAALAGWEVSIRQRVKPTKPPRKCYSCPPPEPPAVAIPPVRPPATSGYCLENLKTVPASPTRAAAYSIQANPVVSTGLTRTGNDSFYIDDTGFLRHSGSPTQPAGPKSPTYP